jgi:hypothetical protein
VTVCEAADARSERSGGDAPAVDRMRRVGSTSVAMGVGGIIGWLTELPDGAGVLFPYVMSVGVPVCAFGGLLLLIAHFLAADADARGARPTRSTGPSAASPVLVSAHSVAAESDDGRCSAVEMRRSRESERATLCSRGRDLRCD